jgi:putative signal transducing protein
VKIVYRAENIIDANLVKAALAEAGIQAFVFGEYLTGAAGQLPARDLVNVMVAETDIERAAPIAEAIDTALRQQRRETGDSPDPGTFSPA